MTVADVAKQFGQGDLERLPVVDANKKLIGTVAMRDVLARGRF